MNRSIAEAFPPGEYIRDELEARGWTQGDLADILGRTEPQLSDLINGKRTVTLTTAKELAAAFGTSAQVWLNLETTFQLWRDQTEQTAVERRAQLYALAPVKDMIKRGWIEASSDLDILEKQILDFLGIDKVDASPDLLGAAARTSTAGTTLSPAQIAWLVRARQLARAVDARPYSAAGLPPLVVNLRSLMGHAEEIRRVPGVLAEAGIRFVLVEHLPRTRIDGGTVWLDGEMPVLAVSTRYDKIDAFWFTVMHELGHISQDGEAERLPRLDVDLIAGPGQERSSHELAEATADGFATECLVPQDELDEFIQRVGPLYSHRDIRGFAARMKVHPGIAVGLIHHSQHNWEQFNGFLVKIRHLLAPSAMTDGWGQTVRLGRD